jgi:predicted PurR-regulated permease PerM
MAQAKQERNGDWLTRERVLVIVLAAVTGIAFYICYQLAEPFLSPLTWALALAVVAHPVHRWIGKRMKAKTLAAALAVLVVTVALIVPVVFVVREIAHEAAAGVEKVKNEATEGRWRKAVEANPRFAGTLKWIEREVNVKEEVERASKWIMNNVGKIVSGSISVVTGLLVTLFLLFYFFRDQERILGALKGLVPLSRPEADEVIKRIRDTIHAIVNGTLVVALIQGILGGLMFWGLGLPSPLLWGAVMAVLSVLPFFGAAIVWVPAAVFLALEGDWNKALILTAWGSIVVALIDNLLYPVLVKSRLRLHTVPVFISIVGGLLYFGAAGVVLGPVALAVAAALIDIWRRRTAAGHAAEHGVHASR